MKITPEDLKKVQQCENKIIYQIKDLVFPGGKRPDTEEVVGYMTGIADILVFLAVGCMGRKTGIDKLTEIVNRAIKMLPTDEEIKKLQDGDLI